MQDEDEVFFTDAELMARRKCSKMTLWRLREANKLPRPLSSVATQSEAAT